MLNSINFNFNEHSYSPPSSLTVFSIANTHVRVSLLVLYGLLLGTRSLAALEVLKELEVLEVDVVEDDAIFDLRPEGPSRRTMVA